MTFGALTVTAVRRGWDGSTRDRHNNPVTSELGTVDLVGCFLQQQTSSEDLDTRDTTSTRWVLFAPVPEGVQLGPEDRFRIDAAAARVDPDAGETFATFEQVGQPDTLDHIDGTAHHLELILERVEL